MEPTTDPYDYSAALGIEGGDCTFADALAEPFDFYELMREE